MNIFATYPDPKKSARVLDDKRVIKMILESAQLLCTALTQVGVEVPYRPTHTGHPCTVWVSKSRHNARWLWYHAMELCSEYTLRFGKVHKTQAVLEGLMQHLHLLPDTPFTDPPNCARRSDLGIDYTHIEDVYKSYRNYLHARLKAEFGKPRVNPRYSRSDKLISVTLKRIESTHQNLRTDEVKGIAHNAPNINDRFFMYAEALEEGDVRHVMTSPVRDIWTNGEEIIFKTENSVYSLTVHGAADVDSKN